MAGDNIIVWPLTKTPRILPVPARRDLPHDIWAAIDAAWEDARRSRPSLFNGRLFSIGTETPDPPTETLSGEFVDYKWLIAQRLRPELTPYLNVRPLGVTGVVLCDGAILLARRSADSTQNPGAWEIAPAGGMDEGSMGPEGVDPIHQLLTEFREETGLEAAAVRSITLICWMLERAAQVRDMVYKIELAIPRAALDAHLNQFSSPEHTEFELMPLTWEVPAHLRGSPVSDTCAPIVALLRSPQA